jgi:hypothetical protein
MRELWPTAILTIRAKPTVPHARSLRITLGDRREITILLDQGFGGWKASGAPRHNFNNSPAAQARDISSAPYSIAADAPGTPIFVWEGAATQLRRQGHL